MATGHQETFTYAIVLAASQEFRRRSAVAVTVQCVGKAFGILVKVQDVAAHHSPVI